MKQDNLRLSTHDNPLGLKLGELVRVRRICFVDYDVHGNKDITYSEELPFEAVVVGSVKRALGKFSSGRSYLSLEGPVCDDPPRLIVSKYVRLYEVKVLLTDKPFLVHPDDIEVL